ncbi:Crp/Fnr family transcriptional regulator [Glycomyces harbinensis]|uniref:cAMP-binding domain of CRP or a regulatory subunit of cAMP-dependent protein kinases n=1 Tax=Glycomyces harbinensis TaxID=58114 RepID=A0A1G7A5B2_9ACTN|nr:Crp/Fnr family transcriptional regulator [Glycomyces harbinensis]SDE09086.1 cAMP-binding domain of CRP or a regulatory subunit of cAMP-dependent protein kinases [Glycomyces harbinensis]
MDRYTSAENLLTDEERESLLPLSHPVTYPGGSVLVREGDSSTFVLYLRSGHIKAETSNPRAIVYIYSPGKIVGELAAITSARRTADLVALNGVEADLIPGDVWLDFLLKNRRATLAMFEHLANRIVSKDLSRPESVTSTEHKIAKGLLRLVAAGMGKPVEDGLRISGVTQRDIGSLSGLSRESAAVVLRMLRESNTVSTGRGHLTIHDLGAIEKLAQRNGPAPLAR